MICKPVRQERKKYKNEKKVDEAAPCCFCCHCEMLMSQARTVNGKSLFGSICTYIYLYIYISMNTTCSCRLGFVSRGTVKKLDRCGLKNCAKKKKRNLSPQKFRQTLLAIRKQWGIYLLFMILCIPWCENYLLTYRYA